MGEQDSVSDGPTDWKEIGQRRCYGQILEVVLKNCLLTGTF